MSITALQPSRSRSRTAELVLRRATTDDADALLALYEGLGAESRYRRFFRATPRYDAGLQRHITDVASSLVWVAFDGDRCVGEARVVSSTRQPCGDLAVTVADDYQGRGLGSRLARRRQKRGRRGARAANGRRNRLRRRLSGLLRAAHPDSSADCG